jgi:hypothetical protein
MLSHKLLIKVWGCPTNLGSQGYSDTQSNIHHSLVYDRKSVENLKIALLIALVNKSQGADLME